jgi:hypothetical protein
MLARHGTGKASVALNEVGLATVPVVNQQLFHATSPCARGPAAPSRSRPTSDKNGFQPAPRQLAAAA